MQCTHTFVFVVFRRILLCMLRWQASVGIDAKLAVAASMYPIYIYIYIYIHYIHTRLKYK